VDPRGERKLHTVGRSGEHQGGSTEVSPRVRYNKKLEMCRKKWLNMDKTSNTDLFLSGKRRRVWWEHYSPSNKNSRIMCRMRQNGQNCEKRQLYAGTDATDATNANVINSETRLISVSPIPNLLVYTPHHRFVYGRREIRFQVCDDAVLFSCTCLKKMRYAGGY
jgi:hypothetical protein